MNKYRVEIIDSFSDKLQSDWLNFEKKSCHYIFQSYEWQKLWLDTQLKYGNRILNYTILVFEKNELVMLLPFNIKNFYSINILNWSGFPFSDYNAPLLAKNKILEEEDFKLIWKNILNKIKKVDCIVFDNQPEKIFEKKNPFYHFLNNKINNEYNGIKLNNDFQIKKYELGNIKYQINRLKKFGKLEFKIAKESKKKKKILDFIVQHKTKQYINTKVWNLFKQKFNKEFFILSNLIMSKKSYITYLEINNEIIAAHSGYVYQNVCYYLFPVYNLEYQKYSPGKILLKYIIEDSKINTLSYFDLTIGSESYKKNFFNNKFLASIYFKSLNFKGFIYIFVLKIKFKIKIILKKFEKNK